MSGGASAIASPLAFLHERAVAPRRARVLAARVLELLPAGPLRVVDVGCGDGAIGAIIGAARPEVSITGLEILPRPSAQIPVRRYGGGRLPLDEGACEVVLLIDVVHHARDPARLLAEAARVARRAVIVKDHLREGPLASPTLRFMDRVGNRRHRVPLPYRYWTRRRWLEALGERELEIAAWNDRPGLYPWPARLLCERSLHFIARFEPSPAPAAAAPAPPTPPAAPGQVAGDAAWEAAYLRFESPRREARKFRRRLRGLGAGRWPRNARIVDLFCGAGGGLEALERLGFARVEGVDRSPSLLEAYRGPFRCHRADCRALPFAAGTKDIAIVQGGLHHLERLPGDLDAVLGEVRRVLVEGGRLIVVEPWPTPFLALVHGACRVAAARRAWPRLDALATMIEHERETYEGWLGEPGLILERLAAHFEPRRVRRGWGKLSFVGRRTG